MDHLIKMYFKPLVCEMIGPPWCWEVGLRHLEVGGGLTTGYPQSRAKETVSGEEGAVILTGNESKRMSPRARYGQILRE